MSDADNGVSRAERNGTVVYHSTEDLDKTELSTAVLAGLDSVPGYDVENGDTVVFDHIDLDALDELFSHAKIGDPRGQVTFSIGGYQVTVTADGEIIIRTE